MLTFCQVLYFSLHTVQALSHYIVSIKYIMTLVLAFTVFGRYSNLFIYLFLYNDILK